VRDAYEPELPIRTERLVLRRMTDADAPALTAYRSLPEVCRFLPFEPMTEQEVREKLRDRWASLVLDGPGSALRLGIEVDGTLVGDIVLFVSGASEDETVELGWVLAPEHEGHGYATEAARALLPVAFDGLGAHRVIARMDPQHVGSAAVATRLGMRREALLIENEFIKGQWLDTLYFALLEREYRAS
jgi:RimJ/RimL family protein N-acetyltransferase